MLNFSTLGKSLWTSGWVLKRVYSPLAMLQWNFVILTASDSFVSFGSIARCISESGASSLSLVNTLPSQLEVIRLDYSTVIIGLVNIAAVHFKLCSYIFLQCTYILTKWIFCSSRSVRNIDVHWTAVSFNEMTHISNY